MKKLQKAEASAEIAEVEVNEEDLDMDGASELQASGKQELDPMQVQQGRREEREYMTKKLQMFEFGSVQATLSRSGNAPTTTKWVDRMKKDDDRKEFAGCRLVVRDFKPKREGPRDDLFAAMPPLEANKALFAFVAVVRLRRRERGPVEEKLMFVDVRKRTSTPDVEEWVELPDDFEVHGR